MFKRIVVGVSGGVDSAVATFLLKEKGFSVSALFMQNWDLTDESGVCNADKEFMDASEVCQKLGVPIFHVNFVKEYWTEVFSNFLKEYENGYTPNPDILCNRYIKFDHFYHYAREYLYADAIGTGHYAKTTFGPYLEEYNRGKVKLLRPLDQVKDQTFFLSQVNQDALRKTMFPLSNLLKSEVKEIALQNKLQKVAKKKESMGICFIGNRNFQSFIAEYLIDKPGKFVDIDSAEIIGEHNGIHQWTIGQRTRLEGKSLPFYVARKDLQTNSIYVAGGHGHSALHTELFFTDKPHWIYDKPKELKNCSILNCTFTDQHTKDAVDCEVCETDKGLIVNIIYQSRRALAPGQFAVFYKNDECLGSARINNSGPSNYLLYWLQWNKIAYVAHRIARFKPHDKVAKKNVKKLKNSSIAIENKSDTEDVLQVKN